MIYARILSNTRPDGWYAQIFDTEQIYLPTESGDSPTEYATTLYRSNLLPSQEAVRIQLNTESRPITIVDYHRFEQEVDRTLTRQARAIELKMRALGWNPLSTGLACVLCSAPIEYETLPKFESRMGGVYGQIYYSWYYCTLCSARYCEKCYPDYTQLDGKTPLRPCWSLKRPGGEKFEDIPLPDSLPIKAEWDALQAQKH